ncbi:hypothetical protein KY289_011039 [Solanum tuberosum]|nr:hypothetical protein KY289_011039 [Solanum tuberosum]KAH0709308.1 hypothetical protein KY284_010735 [Solanum tuberosum]
MRQFSFSSTLQLLGKMLPSESEIIRVSSSAWSLMDRGSSVILGKRVSGLGRHGSWAINLAF